MLSVLPPTAARTVPPRRKRPLRTALPVNLFFCLIFASFQAVAYHMPFITHSWLFNEVLGFAPGIGMGWLWGRGLAMLLDIPTRGQQVYKDI